MSTFALFLLCIQGCLVQNVLGASCGRLDAPAIVAPACGCGDLGYGAGLAGTGCGSYGGAGIGNIAVASELPVAGTTTVSGHVPIIGAVGFRGDARAGGAVSIAGRCTGCGCGCGAY